MRSMTFQLNDQSTGSAVPAVFVTITENADGTVSFTINVAGSYTGDLRGFFFDLSNEARIGTLTVASASAGLTEFQQGNDTVANLGDGANMQGLLGSEGGYDAGLEIGTAGIGRDDYQSFSFTLASSAGALTLEDFAGADFGVRLTSVGEIDGSRTDSAKLLEHTSSAIDARDDSNSVQEDTAPNPVSGNVFANDLNLGTTHGVTAVNGSAASVGVDIDGTYGTLHLNSDGSYTYTLDNTRAAVQALAQNQVVTESFSYSATAFDEATSSSSDSALLTISITGTNDAPAIATAVATGTVAELADGAPGEGIALHAASGSLAFTDVDLTDAPTLSVTPAAGSYLGSFSAAIANDSTGDGAGELSWNFQVSDGAIEYLGAGESLAQSYTLALDDGHGGVATREVTVTISGANDAPETTGGAVSGAVTEDAPVDTVFGAVTFTDIDLTDVHNVSFAPAPGNTTALGTFVLGLLDDPASSADGSVEWRYTLDNAAAQYLEEGETVVERYTVTVQDASGASATQDVTITIAGTADNNPPDAVDDFVDHVGGGSGGPINVAVIGTPISGFNQTAAQLSDSAAFSIAANAIPVSSYSTAAQWTSALAGYDVVIIGDSGFFDSSAYESAQLFPALRGYVDSGHGVITTGWFTFELNGMSPFSPAAADADYISPVARGSYTWAGGGTTMTVLDPSHPIAQGITSYVVNTAHHEETIAIDPSATRLAFGPDVLGYSTFMPVAGIAYDEIGAGHTAYLGGLYMASPLNYGTFPLRSGVFDQLLEQAVNWAGGNVGGGSINEDAAATIAGATLLANDSDPDAGDTISILSVSPTSSSGAAVSLVGGDVLYDPTGAAAIQALDTGETLDDTFTYTIADNHGATDSATVTVRVAGRNDAPVALDDFNTATDDGVAVLGNVVANDTDPDVEPLFVTNPGVYGLGHGNLTINPDGSYSYVVTDESLGVGDTAHDTFTYSASDGTETRSAALTLDLFGSNDAPDAVDDAIGGAAGTTVLTFDDISFNVFEQIPTGYGGFDWRSEPNPFNGGSLADLWHGGFGGASIGGSHAAWTAYGAQVSHVTWLGTGTVNIDGAYFSNDSSAFHLHFSGYNDGVLVDQQDVFGLAYGSPTWVQLDFAGIDDLVILSDAQNTWWSMDNLSFRQGGPATDEDHALTIAGATLLANDGDVDGDSLSIVSASGTSAQGASVSLLGGNIVYDPTTSAALQDLDDGESAVDTFTYTITDGHGGTDTATVRLTVAGVTDGNTPPDITGGTTTGLIYEDGGAFPRRASGQLSASDPDPDATLSWTTEGSPVYGTVGVDATGRWTYTLNDGVAQQLAQGQTFDDTFTVRVTDNHNASDTQLVTVTVTGTDDRPNLPTSPLAISVFEDGGSGSNTTSAFDVDNGALLHWSLNRDGALGYFSDYHFSADSFSIVKNGALIFSDGFDAGGPPPSAPNFSNGTTASYTANGVFQEVDGKLILSGSNAVAFRGTGFDGLIAGTEAILNTNNNPADTVAGLKINHAFTVEGVFDLIDPQLVRQGYGIQLTDGFNQLADDLITLQVRREADDGQVYVRLTNSSAVLDTATLVARDLLFAGGADQIRFRLEHVANSGDVSASYEMLTGGIVTGGGSLGSVGIFGTDTPFAGDDENWIRAGVTAFGPDLDENVQMLAGNYGTLTVSPGFGTLGQLTYTPDNANPAVQALAQGQTAIDTFWVRAVDEHGMSSAQRVDVTVNGVNDAPVAVADFNSVIEDVQTVASGNVLTNDTDVDAGTVLSVLSTGTFGGAYGSLTLNANGTYVYQLDHALADALADGQVVHDVFSFDYSITDGIAVTSSTLLDITITGTADAVAPADGQVFEDGSRRDSGQLALDGLDAGNGLTATVSGAGPMTPRADYRFLIDNLNIFRNGAQFFNDDFGNGLPPPSGTTFGYFTSGTFLEANGRAIMDGGLGVASTIPGGIGTVISQIATLNTDIGPDVTQGLKRAQDFRVEARYDLVMPDEVFETYTVRLSDGADDIAELAVRRMEDGSVGVALREVDVAGTIPVTLQVIPLAVTSGDNQIVLRLQHAAGSDLVTTSFDLLNAGVITQTGNFTQTAHIFGNEDWTRVQISSFSPAMPLNGVYGTLSVDADGEWHYSLNNPAANVQALAQNERSLDTFGVTLTDGHGASTTQTVTVAVTGSDDAPGPVTNGLGSFFQGGGINGTYVVEDGSQAQVTHGHGFAPDVDHAATLSWSVSRGNPGYPANYNFTVDNLFVEKNGAVFVNDAFNDGAPLSTPGFSYLTNGAGFSESGDRLVLNGQLAAQQRGVGITDLMAGHISTLSSNIDPADLTRGLKSDDDFRVEARYDLVIPGVRSGYGVAFNDNVTGGLPPDQLGDDSISVEVARDAAGNVVVRLVERDIVADRLTVLDSTPLTPGAGDDQIVLRLAHDHNDVGTIHASFDLLDGGVVTGSFAFAAVGHIFGTDTPDYAGDDEDWTRVQLQSLAPDTAGTTAQGIFGSLNIDPTSGDWAYALDNSSAIVQSLMQGQVVTDTFNIRATDQFGVSNRGIVNINVVGTGEDLVPVNPIGTAGNDVLIGSPLADFPFVGGGGSDLLIGLGGRDIFDYNSLSDGVDTIADFTPGPIGDALDIRDVLVGYVPGGSNPSNFVQLAEFMTAGGVPNTTVRVNADGVGTDFVPLANLQGVGGLLLDDLLANGNLIVA